MYIDLINFISHSSIRLMVLLSKGLFSIFLVRYITESDFGLFVVIGVTVSFYQYALAADFAYVAHREILSGGATLGAAIGTQTFLLFFGIVILVFPIHLLFPIRISWSLFFKIIIILLFETVTNEIQRYLVLLQQEFQSNLVMLIKSALWMVPVLVTMNFGIKVWILDEIVGCWIFGLCLALFYGCRCIRDNLTDNIQLDTQLLKKYLLSVPIVLVGTLSVRAIFSIDKIFVSKTLDRKDVAVYGLYAGIAAAFAGLLDAGILNREYSAIIRNSRGKAPEFRKQRLLINLKTGTFIIAALLIYIQVLPKLLIVVGKEEWGAFKEVGAYLLIANGVYALSFADNCYIYAKNADKMISIANLFSFISLFISISKFCYSMRDVAFAVFIATLINLAVKRQICVVLFKK